MARQSTEKKEDCTSFVLVDFFLLGLQTFRSQQSYTAFTLNENTLERNYTKQSTEIFCLFSVFQKQTFVKTESVFV